jgi:uncharacterized protein
MVGSDRDLRRGVDLAEVTGRFAQALHAAGVPVTPERAGRLAATLGLDFPTTTAELYWLARVTLVADRTQLDAFDRVFRSVFGGHLDVADHRGDANAPPSVEARPGDERRHDHRPDRQPGSTAPPPSPTLASLAEGDGGDGDGTDAVLAAVSREERLRAQSFATLTEHELDDVRRLVARLTVTPPSRRSRRTVRRHGGHRLDVRAALRRAHRTGGDPVRLERRAYRPRPRRLVLLCDISGSMAPYARAYLQLLHASVRGARAEAFAFATRLTRLTRALQVADPDEALRQAGSAAPDWSGGTRIGEALKAFNDGWGRRGVARGAVVVIVSDGWERDDPALLGREMERLAHLAHRIVWVNPRRAGARYQPLVGGMAAALPHVDAFVSGHSLAALDDVLAAIAGS